MKIRVQEEGEHEKDNIGWVCKGLEGGAENGERECMSG